MILDGKQGYKQYMNSPYSYNYPVPQSEPVPNDSAIYEQIRAINFGLPDPRIKEYLLAPSPSFATYQQDPNK